MSTITIYHGSPQIVEAPSLAKGKLHNDYGRGFYCTESFDLAREWACPERGRNGFANRYTLDTDGLTELDLSDPSFTALHWLALLLEHRIVDTRTAVASRGKRYLAEHFAVNIEPYDIVRGWRADDSYFSFARAFLQNAISYEQLVRVMRAGELGEQVVLRKEAAFEQLRFDAAEPADASEWYPKRAERDERARALFRSESETDDLEGLYLRDIIREQMGADDARLR